MKIFQVIFFISMCISCKENDCSFAKVNPTSATYIKIYSATDEVVIMPFSSLIFITEFDYLDFSVGRKERSDIACGLTKISAIDSKILQEKSECPIFKLKDNKLLETDLQKSYKNSMHDDGLFDINDFDHESKGQLIKNAIENNIKITFSEYEGVFRWSR